MPRANKILIVVFCIRRKSVLHCHSVISRSRNARRFDMRNSQYFNFSGEQQRNSLATVNYELFFIAFRNDLL